MMLLWGTPAIAQTCNEEVYGSVNAAECMAAFNALPLTLEPASSRAKETLRYFVEPQYQSPKFGAIRNGFFPAAIVQLPKIWKSRKSATSRV